MIQFRISYVVMELILDGSLDIGAYVQSESAIQSVHTFAHISELPSDIGMYHVQRE